METVLDAIWRQIVIVFQNTAGVVDVLLLPLHPAGAAVIVAFLAFLTVIATKALSSRYQTERYLELKKTFDYWYNLKQEALKGTDAAKGRKLAKNIDQAHLNRAYYDLFFESLLISMATRWLPILLVLAYVNEAFRPERLMSEFGQPYLFIFQGPGGRTWVVGSVLWFVAWLFGAHILRFAAAKVLRSKNAKLLFGPKRAGLQKTKG